MSDIYGHSYAKPLMRYDQESCSWRTCEDTSLWDLEMFSPTFPEWGMTRNGVLFEQAMPVLHTLAHAFSFLPTPLAREEKEAGRLYLRYRDGSYDTDTVGRAIAVLTLLPTPTTQDSRTGTSQDNRNSIPLNRIETL